MPTSTEWTLQDHQTCGKDIRTWFKLIDFYIEEVHKKKMFQMKRTGRFYPNSPEVESAYRKYLFHNKKRRTSFDDFPCAFKCELEDCMYRDHKDKEDCTINVYYNLSVDDLKPSEGPDLTPLDPDPNMTDADHATLKNLNVEYVAFMDKCIAFAKHHAKRRKDHSEFKKMKKFRARVVKYALA